MKELQECACDWGRLAEASFDADLSSLATIRILEKGMSNLATWIEMVCLKSSKQVSIFHGVNNLLSEALKIRFPLKHFIKSVSSSTSHKKKLCLYAIPYLVHFQPSKTWLQFFIHLICCSEINKYIFKIEWREIGVFKFVLKSCLLTLLYKIYIIWICKSEIF